MSVTRPRKLLPLGAIASLLAFCSCFSGIPAHSSDSSDQDPGVIKVDVALVMVDATVKTKSGQVMTGLNKDDFEIRDDGVTQKIGHFSRDSLPLDLVLVLDLSESIRPYLGPLQDAARTVLGALKPEDQVALVTFSDEAELRVPLTTEKDKISEAFPSLHTGGLTNINDGLYFAADYLRTAAPKGRRVVVLISDNVGTDPGEHDTRDIVAASMAADAPVYSFRVPGDNPKKSFLSSNHIPGIVNIHKVMDATGGEMFDVLQASHLGTIFGELMERIKTRYTLGYYASADQRHVKDKDHRLDVRLTSSFGTKGRNYVILAKSGYTAP